MKLKESRLIKHLVVDEMQDHTPIQYAVINRLFPCQKKFLGDFGQFISPTHLHTLAQLQDLYSGASLMELNKSYRSTYEIITFAKDSRILEQNLMFSYRATEFPLVSSLKQITPPKCCIVYLRRNTKLNSFLPTAPVSQTASLLPQSKGLEFDEVIVPNVSDKNYHTEYDSSLLYIACTWAMHKLSLFTQEIEPHLFLNIRKKPFPQVKSSGTISAVL